MKTLLAIVLGTLLLPSPALSDAPLPDWQIKSRLELARTVILVRVVESTFRGAADSLPVSTFPSATVLVLRSWKGPFSAGHLLHAAPPGFCAGSRASCQPYPLHAGDEVLIFAQQTDDPIVASEYSVFRAAESKATMEVLDQAVKEQVQLHDPQTDITRAPERQRMLLALTQCLAESSRHQGDGAFHSHCVATDTSVLVGIKRAELVAALGPPTWCQRSYPFGYLPGASGDCPAEQTPVWSFEPTPTTPGGLMCQSDESVRCMHIGWFTVAQ
jgi:hypothetical protein